MVLPYNTKKMSTSNVDVINKEKIDKPYKKNRQAKTSTMAVDGEKPLYYAGSGILVSYSSKNMRPCIRAFAFPIRKRTFLPEYFLR